MSNELEEKSTRIEIVKQKQLVETMKVDKKEHDYEQRSTASTRNTTQTNFSEIFEKIDSKIPSYVQLYSELYKKYLDIARNFWEVSYLNQKEAHDKMGVNDVRLDLFDAYLGSVKKMVLFQIDLSENMIKSYVNHRLSVLEFYDQMMSNNISNFAKMFPKFNVVSE